MLVTMATVTTVTMIFMLFREQGDNVSDSSNGEHQSMVIVVKAISWRIILVSPQRNREEGDGERETKLKSLFEIISVLPFKNLL